MSFIPPTSKSRQGFKPPVQKSTQDAVQKSSQTELGPNGDQGSVNTQEIVPSSQFSEDMAKPEILNFSLLEEIPDYLSQG